MPKMVRNFSLEVSLCDALRDRSAVTGRSMTEIVEEGLRHVLALPPQEKVDALSKTERKLLEVIKAAGPGWHDSFALSKGSHETRHTTEKALDGLARGGDVYLWGDFMLGDQQLGSCWGTKPAIEVVSGLVSKMTPDMTQADFKLLVLVRRLALGMSNASEARALVAKKFGIPESSTLVENFAERRERMDRDYEEQQREDQAAHDRELIKRRQAMMAHDLEQKRLDAQARGYMPQPDEEIAV